MTFVTIQADGELVVDERPATLELVGGIVDPDDVGYATIWLGRQYGTAGWTNDGALIATNPDGSPTHPRNPVAACVLVTMRAPQQAYAGDIVLTGYNYGDDGGQPLDLPHNTLEAIRDIHGAVRRVLAGEPPRVPWASPSWPREMRTFADAVTAGDIVPHVIVGP